MGTVFQNSPLFHVWRNTGWMVTATFFALPGVHSMLPNKILCLGCSGIEIAVGNAHRTICDALGRLGFHKHFVTIIIILCSQETVMLENELV
jgi:hypothetical protein